MSCPFPVYNQRLLQWSLMSYLKVIWQSFITVMYTELGNVSHRQECTYDSHM
jgi:hypothetical protein